MSGAAAAVPSPLAVRRPRGAVASGRRSPPRRAGARASVAGRSRRRRHARRRRTRPRRGAGRCLLASARRPLRRRRARCHGHGANRIPPRRARGPEQVLQRGVRQVLLGDERRAPQLRRTSSGSPRPRRSRRARPAGAPAARRARTASSTPLPSGSPTSTSAARGRRLARGGEGLGDGAGLAAYLEAAGLEHPAREAAEDGVVVDEKDHARDDRSARGAAVSG